MRLPAILIALLIPLASLADDPSPRLIFAGDVLLGREVGRQIALTGRPPWAALRSLFDAADWRSANLEGAIGGPGECVHARPCLTFPPASIDLLRQAGFDALSQANNHSGDAGPAGIASTAASLEAAGIAALRFDASPRFFRLRDITLAVVAISLVPEGGTAPVALPGIELAQRLRLARRLADLVAVQVHWGRELQDWPDPEQRRQALWLIAQGADLILGHHPHVIQAPECLGGRPVFYSLGNHLFDQKYPLTKRGLIADCRVEGRELVCQGRTTRAPLNGAFPTLEREAAFASTLDNCRVRLSEPLQVRGMELRPRSDGTYTRLTAWRGGRPVWEGPALPLLAIEGGRLAEGEGEVLLTLQRHYSPLDQELGVRPYVYALEDQGLRALWRGSALAWPLMDAVLLPGTPVRLCALHRADSFLLPDPDAGPGRVMVYTWSGFGFRGLDDPQAQAACARHFGMEGT